MLEKEVTVYAPSREVALEYIKIAVERENKFGWKSVGVPCVMQKYDGTYQCNQKMRKPHVLR